MKPIVSSKPSHKQSTRDFDLKSRQNRKRFRAAAAVFAIGLLLLALFLLSGQRKASAQGPSIDAQETIQQAWNLAQSSGAYAFDADITQERRPLASVTNVGRQTTREQLYLEGRSNLEAQSLEMTLWMQGGLVQNKGTGSQIRVEGDTAYARQGDQPWEEINNFTGLFAPENDFMAYLAAAVNVQDQGYENRAGIGFTRVTFDIDGQAYARHIRDQIQAEMTRKGDLPQGVNLAVPEMYSGMTGSGELWIGDDGLPLRQILNLSFPPGEEEQVSAEVTVNFRDFSPLPGAASLGAAGSPSQNQAASSLSGSATVDGLVSAVNWLAPRSLSLFIAAALMGFFYFILARSRRSRTVLTGLQLTLIFSMLFSPLLQSVHVGDYFARQRIEQETAEARNQNSGMLDALQSLFQEESSEQAGTVQDIANDDGADSDGDGFTDVQEMFLGTESGKGLTGKSLTPSLAPNLDVPNVQLPPDDGSDKDGDGLTDYVEALLGTLDYVADTDGDLISDGQEVLGFTAYGETWYTDPFEMDTNRDGIGDGQEWTSHAVNGVPADSDGDMIPDLFDDDNDGDGVPDKLDLSPYTANQNIFDGDNPFSLVLNGLTQDKLTYVEFQLRPETAEHLTYAFNALDWPDDNQGNIQDGNSSVEDVRLLPMLEIVVPAASAHLLPLDVLAQYDIMDQPLPNGDRSLYVPLFLVTNDKGDQNVAFNGKMVYNGAAHWGDEHQVRLVWIVQALNDVCGAFDDSGLCEDYEFYDKPQVIHTYDDPWQLTGFTVQENHSVDIATVYENPAVDDDLNLDTSLWHLSFGLDHSFMAGGVVTGTTGTRLWDVAEIERRFDHNTNAGIGPVARWNISNTLSVTTASYDHLDEALMTTAQTTTVNILNNNFSSHWSTVNPISPTLLFARQDKYRSFNLDENGSEVSWQNNRLSLNIPESAVPLETANSLTWAPFQYDEAEASWKSYSVEAYWDHLGRVLEPDMTAEFSDPEVSGGGVLLAQFYYIALMNGVFNIVQSGEQRLEHSFFGEDRPLGASITSGGRAGAVFLIKFIMENKNIEATDGLRLIFSRIRDARLHPAANPLGTTKLAVSAFPRALFALKGAKFGMALGMTILVAGAIVTGIYFLAKDWLGDGGPSQESRIVTAVIVGAVTTYTGVIAPIFQIRALASFYQAAGFGALSAADALAEAALKAESVSKGAKVAAAVGLVIAIGISWGIFIYAVTAGNIAPGSVAFSTLLAQTIAATIIAVIQFALSFTLVGAIIVAILGIIDLLLFILGVNFSLNGWLTETLGKFIYHFELTIESDVDTGEPGLALVDPNTGMVDGALMAASMPVTTTITHDDPDDFWGWRVIPYLPVFYNRSNIRSTTFQYTLTTEEDSLNVGRDQMRGQWQDLHTDHHYLLTPMIQATNQVTPTTNMVLEAGLNGALPLYFNNGYALPGVECWTIPIPFWPWAVPICVGKTIDGQGSSDIGSSLILDVLPDTLDGFMALDWGGNLPFNDQPDYDNDGLMNRALNGNDPDDFNWDTDFDGLSDAYELERRANGDLFSPLNADSDFDGLSDYDEIRFRTDPGLQDTDQDGLLDSEEVWHYDTRSQTWEGGWAFTLTYTGTNQVPNQTLTTRIFSDPLVKDTDNDGLTDGVEKTLHELDPAAYPYSPFVFNENPVAVYVGFDDDDGFVQPNQSVVVSATVQNNLSSDLYALGDLTLTLPNQLGGGALTQEFNVFQAQSTSIVADFNVLGTAGSGPIELLADYFAHLHNGDLNWQWNWLPRVPADTDFEASITGGSIYEPMLAANPGNVSYDYALAALDAPNNDWPYNSYGVLPNGSVTASQANTQIGQANGIGVHYPDAYHTSKYGNYGTDIACNAAGKCAQTYVNTVWKSCANVYFDYVHVEKENDAGSQGEYYLRHEGAKFWGVESGSPGNDLNIGLTRWVCTGDEIKAYEEDNWPNKDDNLGTHVPDMTAPHTASHTFSHDGDKIILYYRVLPNPERWGLIRLLNSSLNPDTSTSTNATGLIVNNTVARQTANSAVAGSNDWWVFGFETFGAPSEIYLNHIKSDGGQYADYGTRLDTDDLSAGNNDHNLDLAWVGGNNFLAVWESDWSAADHDIKMATVSVTFGNALVVNARKNVDSSTTNETDPHVAYSPHLNRSLVVYKSQGSGIVGRFVQGPWVGPRFNIGQVINGESLLTEPRVAYDARNNVWIVSWIGHPFNGTERIHYRALEPGTFDGAAALTPPQTINVSPGRTHNLDCATGTLQDNDFRITSNCAIVIAGAQGSNSMRLDTIMLESTPPWLDGGGGLTSSAAAQLTVDADMPTADITSFAAGETVNITDTFIFGGSAGDPTSNVALVEVNIDGAGWQPAAGTGSWAYAWEVPDNDGTHTIQVRVTDVVGNVATESPISIVLDRAAPTTAVNGTPDDFVTTVQDSDDRWHISFDGTAADGLSSVAAVEAVISPSGSGWQTASLTGGSWSVDYVLPEFDENGQKIVNPTGVFTLTVRARDSLGNVTEVNGYSTLPFLLDTTPPEATLTDFGPSLGVISDTLTLSGVITDSGAVSAGIQQLEIDFVPVGQISDTWTAVTLASSGPGVTTTTWSHPVPANMEGNFLINLRGTDVRGNQTDESQWLTGWQGEIDTMAPRTQVTVTLQGAGKAAKTYIEATIYDRNLTETGLEFPCPVQRMDRGYETDAFLYDLGSGQEQLTSLHIECKVRGFVTGPITLRVFDQFGSETVETVTADLPSASAFGPTGFGPTTLPTIASTVLTPSHESGITAVSTPITIEGGAYAINGLDTLTMTINGSFYYSTSWAAGPVVTDTLWQTTFTPTIEGEYELATTAKDLSGTVQTELQPVTIIVDAAPPTLTLDSMVLSASDQLSSGRVELSGTADDAIGLEAVTVSIDGGPPMAAEINGSAWRFVWPIMTEPDGGSYNVVIEAGDAANTTTINTTVTVDVVAPQNMAVTTGYTDGSTSSPIVEGETVRDTNATGLTTSWTAATDGSGVGEYLVGWTNSPTPTLPALTAYPDNSTTHTTAVSDATVWFAHMAAIDTVGNGDIQSSGPFYIDAPTTPDYINPVDGLGYVYRGWMESGCTLVGANHEVARYAPDGAALNGVQRFYVSWDATNLRLAWTGADWNVDGDLYIYLDTVGGGATSAYNPYGSGAAVGMPDEGGGRLEADYLILVEDGGDASLLSWNGSWNVIQSLTAPNFLFDPNGEGETTDLYLPFSWIGSPSSLKLVALASEEDTLRLWAAMPDQNPLNSERAVNPVALTSLDLAFDLTQHYEWANIGSGVCPADGQFENAPLQFELVAEPAGVSVGFLHHDLPGLTTPGGALDSDLDGVLDVVLPLDVDPAPIGLGQTVSYTLHYANNGTAEATNVVINMTGAGGLTNLSDSSFTLPTVPAGASGTLVITADIDPTLDGESAELQVQISDAVHAPFDWLWVQHDIDSVGPTDVEIDRPIAYIGAFTSTIQGVATDVSGIPMITLRIDGSTTQACPDPTPNDGQWTCLWNAGGAADGTTFTLDARGTDEWGNTGGYGPSVSLVVDTSAPSISLSSGTIANLADGGLNLDEIIFSGSVTDDRSAGGVEICALAAGETEPVCVQAPVDAEGQATANWLAESPVPTTADGESYTLSFYGIDSAGNRSATPVIYVVTADFSGPEIVITTRPAQVGQYATVTVLAGTITDGSGVSSLTLHVTLPNNGDGIQNEFSTVSLGTGPNWSHSMTFAREGKYQFGLVGVDTEGNETILGIYSINSLDVGINVPPTADTGGPYDVNEGQTVTLNGFVDDLNILNGQVITPSWDLDDDGVFEIPGTLTPDFDATNIDGPDYRTIALQVTDGEYTTIVTTTVAIRNLAPTADAGDPYTVDEGAQLTLTGSGADPYPGDTVSFAWDMDEDGVFDNAFGTTAVFSATVLDGPAVGGIVSLQVTDDDGDATVVTTTITVNNVPPQLANLAASPIPENSPAVLTGQIIDPAILDSFDMDIVWGDGRGTNADITSSTAGGAGIALVPGSGTTNQMLRLDAEVFGEGGFQHRFENGTADGWVSQDWSGYEGLSFWYYGLGNGTTIFVEIYDNRNPGSIIDDSERWRYEFADAFAGWQQINVQFTSFDKVERDILTPDDGLGLTEVWGWAFGTAATTGIETRFVDDFTLTDSGGNLLVDDFEDGLPSGTDSNGLQVGFSTLGDSWDGVFYYNYPAGTTSFAESHLYIDDDDDDSYTVNLTIRDDDDGFNTYTTSIAVYNVVPVVSFSPASQSIQYSDGIGPIVITATDVVSDPLAINTTWQVDGGSPNAGLFDGVSLTTDGCADNLDYTQTCTWTLTGIADVPAGEYVISAELSDDDGGEMTVDIPLSITAEDTILNFDPDNPVAVPVDAPGSNAGQPFSLVVTVEELEPDLAAYLAASGDINLANLSITLDPVGPGSSITVPCTPQPVAPVTGYADILSASCDFTAVPVNAYYVLLNVDGGYYAGANDYVLTVYDPSGGISSGAHAAALESCLVTDDNHVKLFSDNTTDCHILAAGKGEVGKNGFVGGSVVSFANVQVKQNAVVSGDALAAGQVLLQNGAVVSGSIVEGAVVYQPVLPIVNVSAGGSNITVNPNTTLALSPGSFGQLEVEAGAVLNLSSGDYAFTSINVDDNAAINLDVADGPILISVEDNVIMEQGVTMTSGGPASDILIQVAGNKVNLGDNNTIVGTFVAPNAFITLDNGATVIGALYSDKIHMRPGSSVIGLPAVRMYFDLYIVPAFSNESPSAASGHNAVNLTVSFTDLSSDPDGSIASWQWDFGDGNSSNSQNPSHSYASAGAYDVTLTVTDNDGAADAVSWQVTVSVGSSAAEMYIDDLNGSTTLGNGNKWNAHITILVLDDLGNPVANAQVSGNWSSGASGSGSCMTDASGYCTVTKTNINGNKNSVTFTVTNVTHPTLTYDASLNVVTSIVVNKPG